MRLLWFPGEMPGPVIANQLEFTASQEGKGREGEGEEERERVAEERWINEALVNTDPCLEKLRNYSRFKITVGHTVTWTAFKTGY